MVGHLGNGGRRPRGRLGALAGGVLVACIADGAGYPAPRLRGVTEIFGAGEANSHGFTVVGYRIPGFIATGALGPPGTSATGGNGSLLVFAEARKYSCSDKSPHDLVAKRSIDGGKTWGPMQMVVEPGVVWGPKEGGPTGGAIYDPTPVVDSKGVIHTIFSYCPARYMARPPIPQAFELWEVTSADDGLTWSTPRNLSAIEPPLRPGEAPWIQRTAGGGGNGIRIQHGPFAGRLVVPGYHESGPRSTSVCTRPQGVATADKWCNSEASCSARPGPLVAVRSGSKSAPLSAEWRCYSPSCLTPDRTTYNVSSGCIEYCTYDAEIAEIVETCQIPPAPVTFTSASHVLLSDDDGVSWRLSQSFFPGTGEGSLAEVGTTGKLLFVARRTSSTKCTNPIVEHCAGTMVSSDGGETWSDPEDVGALPDPGCKNTVASWTATSGLVHGGSHSAVARTNVSALFSWDGGVSWGTEVMVWKSPLVGGYTTVQAWGDTVGIVFENRTCSIAIGLLQ
mmetsp:Transcript_28324/g.84798  ORF Transcript_28324/g.84798 Transcript_28324/m.84798 type:complete len:507 (-) Transcript_28324:28-1548(-)